MQFLISFEFRCLAIMLFFSNSLHSQDSSYSQVIDSVVTKNIQLKKEKPTMSFDWETFKLKDSYHIDFFENDSKKIIEVHSISDSGDISYFFNNDELIKAVVIRNGYELYYFKEGKEYIVWPKPGNLSTYLTRQGAEYLKYFNQRGKRKKHSQLSWPSPL
jgi:hypothetical protein